MVICETFVVFRDLGNRNGWKCISRPDILMVAMADELPVASIFRRSGRRPLLPLGHLPRYVSNVVGCRRWQHRTAERQLPSLTNSHIRPKPLTASRNERSMSVNRAPSIAAMSIFPICIIASRARLAAARSGSAIAAVRTRQTGPSWLRSRCPAPEWGRSACTSVYSRSSYRCLSVYSL